METPRPEHPKPQFERSQWINLNGSWSFAFDFGKSGRERGWQESTGFEGAIVVPFCPESRLSGVEHIDFIEEMWYQRTIEVPESWSDRDVLLHFGGVDFECEAFVDGTSVGSHWGGGASFSFDITPYVSAGSRHNLVVYVYDDTRSGTQGGGKQNPEYRYRENRCHYTRTTGIWQTVWLEAVHPNGLASCLILPDFDQGRFVFLPRFRRAEAGLRFEAVVDEGGQVLVRASRPAADGMPLELSLPNPEPWAPGHPHLYPLRLRVLTASGELLDEVRSYAGLRKVHVAGNRVYLNNEPIYQRLVLDQGFYPEGIWTAPTDDDLRRDIELSLAAGFNGARLHQKVFEERFHYWADRLGYLTWGEYSSWGLDPTEQVSARNMLSEWGEIVERDRNHPSIITWTPLNETRRIESNPRQQMRFETDLYELTHALDPTRPVNDASGYIHARTDLWTVHTYVQSPDGLREQLSPTESGGPFRNYPQWEPAYAGQPYLVDEFGGIKWLVSPEGTTSEEAWGYGDAPKTLEELYARLEGLVETVLSFDHVCGYCYTQLTDVEQEVNGIYTYGRVPKFDMERVHTLFSRTPQG